MAEITDKTPIQPIQDPELDKFGVRLFIKRDDLLHPYASGNKWRKLKYNLQQARQEGHRQLLTFGGAYSNHIFATAALGQEQGFHTIGIIRGEEHLPLNPTLQFAQDCGMQLHYLDRATYREKHTEAVIAHFYQQFGGFYLIPEGGSNALAVKGCAEIATEIPWEEVDVVTSPVGTGGTLAGIISGMPVHKAILGFAALKGGDFLREEVAQLLADTGLKTAATTKNWEVVTAYHFGGYAKKKPELLAFIQQFEAAQRILLDFIYTGKMMFGIFDLVKKGHFLRGTTLLAIHTGGLQLRPHGGPAVS